MDSIKFSVKNNGPRNSPNTRVVFDGLQDLNITSVNCSIGTFEYPFWRIGDVSVDMVASIEILGDVVEGRQRASVTAVVSGGVADHVLSNNIVEIAVEGGGVTPEPEPEPEPEGCPFVPDFGEDHDQSVSFGVLNGKLSTNLEGMNVDVIFAKGSYTEILQIEEVGSLNTPTPSVLGEDGLMVLVENGGEYVLQVMWGVNGNFSGYPSVLTVGGVPLEANFTTSEFTAATLISGGQRDTLMATDQICVDITPPTAPPMPVLEVVEGPNSGDRILSFIVRNKGTATATGVRTSFWEYSPDTWIGRNLTLAEPDPLPKGYFTREFGAFVGETSEWVIGDLEPGEELSLDMEFAPTFFSEGTTIAAQVNSLNASGAQYERDCTPARPAILEVFGPGEFSAMSLTSSNISSWRVEFGDDEETVTGNESGARTLEDGESMTVKIFLDTNRSVKAIRDKARSSSNRTITVGIIDWGEFGGSAGIFEDTATITAIPDDIPRYWYRLGYACQFRSPTEDMITAIAGYDTSRIYRMDNAFSSVTSELYRNIDLSGWNTSRVTDMEGLFLGASTFNGNISNWDTSNVTTMRRMFRQTNEFNQDISGWDVSNVENMVEMFNSAKEFNQDISTWDVSSTSKVVNGFSNMFSGAEKFDQDLTPWVNNPSITNITSLLQGARAFNKDVSEWDVSKFSNMDSMFYGCHSFNQDLTSWDVSHVTSMKNMFFDCKEFNQDISGWDVSSVADMSGMFSGCTVFDQDISTWDVSGCLNFTSMFANSAFNHSLNGWVFNDEASLASVFASASAFNSDISEWDVSKITNLRGMFNGASSFNQDVSDWDTSSVTEMAFMFAGCSAFNQDISTWDVSSATNISYMFYQASSFDQDLGEWDTSSATDMGSMFYQASSFNQDLSGWDTSNVTRMGSMFNGATTFNQDLSGWCVTNIASKPSGFDTSTPAWVKENRQPVWGTCPQG